MTLFISACVRTDSRTEKLAEKLLEKLGEKAAKVRLSEVDFPLTSEEFLRERDGYIKEKDYSAPYFNLAKQFAKADMIVIAAPYWDLSFPAVLKLYIEHINVLGITFEYSSEGIPIGLCKAKKLYYVMTAGGYYVPEEYGFGYIKALAENYYGIKDVELIKATGLDIQGNDAEMILQKCISNLHVDV